MTELNGRRPEIWPVVHSLHHEVGVTWHVDLVPKRDQMRDGSGDRERDAHQGQELHGSDTRREDAHACVRAIGVRGPWVDGPGIAEVCPLRGNSLGRASERRRIDGKANGAHSRPHCPHGGLLAEGDRELSVSVP